MAGPALLLVFFAFVSLTCGVPAGVGEKTDGGGLRYFRHRHIARRGEIDNSENVDNEGVTGFPQTVSNTQFPRSSQPQTYVVVKVIVFNVMHAVGGGKLVMIGGSGNRRRRGGNSPSSPVFPLSFPTRQKHNKTFVLVVKLVTFGTHQMLQIRDRWRGMVQKSDAAIRRVWAMPNSNTFDVKPIGEFVMKYLKESKVSVDPFARNKRWATYTNDLNPATAADYHLDAEDFLRTLAEKGVKADLVIIDPPYSPRQVKECYDGIGVKMKQGDALLGAVRAKLREQINRILVPTGRVMWFGWNSTGMGRKYGFDIEELLLVCHGSDHNDTICFVERRS
jgi:hypothetical protein